MPKMMQNRMRAPGKSRRGIGGVLRELFTYSNKLKAPSCCGLCFAVAGAVLTIIGPSCSVGSRTSSPRLDGEIDLAAIGRTGVILLVIASWSARWACRWPPSGWWARYRTCGMRSRTRCMAE